MSAPDSVYRFLDTQSIGRKSRYCYVSILRAFDAFVHKRASATEQQLSIKTLRAWLKHEIRRSRLPSVVHRLCVIARYLDWRTAAVGGCHILADLRAQYGQLVAPIVQALLEDDYENALLRLQPLPDWGSVLGSTMREHIARMQSLGYRYEARMCELRRFDRFLQRHPELTTATLAQQLEAWRHDARGVRHQLRVQQCGQILSKALHRRDVTSAIFPVEVGLSRRAVQQERRPHLFTEAEIQRLLDAAHTFPSHNASLRPIVLHAMLTLAYCAGLRVGEIVSLTLRDLDLDSGLLEIRDTKFFKSRRLPLSPSAIEVLSTYLEARAAAGAPATPEAPLWWSPRRRCGYSYSTTEKLLIRVLRRAGLKPARGRRGPRIHDVRHTFVAHRMMQWYRNGVDPQSRLPYLATYLGHKDIRSTLVYLNITPELLQQASERYRQRGVDALRATGGRT
jgi:integrase